ncbi:DUF2599 domain-containing protein [Gordonia pseudamarae]|jgi:hypothetical protein|uniref:DUF2599 domain-containing protein n=1 Tax=Gordonia pseudamarae TaxID=2831662 RepID=A0ABX6IL41_9ACTN|nr:MULTISPECIES: DUF2599 domain-containing protein [Gordonia]QHN27742.1 DUF2599 domain-containing protein [Gordonia pseudamarae]QHN36624.1 DUF2599 domain-containing protein [Gordonia pseudamarae]
MGNEWRASVRTRHTGPVRTVAAALAAGALAWMLAACGDSGEVADDTTAGTSTSASVPTTTGPTTTGPSADGSPGPEYSTTPEYPTTQVYRPPYIDHLEWAETEVGPSLRIHPTVSGRNTDAPTAGDEAWSEILTLDPSAESPGMRAQFDCHWTFARLVDPDKTSWNLEPRRPVVTADEMIAARCNPGFAEEPGN